MSGASEQTNVRVSGSVLQSILGYSGPLYLGAIFQQEVDDGGVSLLRRVMQSRVFLGGSGVDICADIDEQLGAQSGLELYEIDAFIFYGQKPPFP